MTKSICALLGASLLAGCAFIDPHNVIGRQVLDPAWGQPQEVVPSPPSTTLGIAARERAFDFVWDTIRTHYYDPQLHGADWNAAAMKYRPLALAATDDEAFWDTLDRMTGELRDAHTRVESPSRVALRNRDESISLGFSFAPVEGHLAVTTVTGDSDAWWAGVRPGMTLRSIGGEPAGQAYERLIADTRLDSTDRSRHQRAMRKLLAGPEGSTLDMGFTRSDGTAIEAHLARRKLSTRAFELHRVLPSGFGYMRFTQWTLGMWPRTTEALDALRNAPGLIVDLRGNPGGSMHMVNEMLGHFFAKQAQLGRILTRTGQPVSILFGAVELVKLHTTVEANPAAYNGPVVILVNAQSASASELFAATMQAAGRATVMGEPTCGCLLGYLGYARIPGGGELAYSEIGFVMSNEKRIEGEGVIPDRIVPITLEDLRMNRDRTLEAAQALLASQTTSAKPVTAVVPAR
jgi:carboxyl-terminal processing protease